MTGYDFHPEAALDLDEIWEFIAEANLDANLDAAGRVIADILAALDKLLPLPNQGHKTSRPRLAAAAVYHGPRVPDCLCARRKTVVGCCDIARTPQPARDGCDFTE